MIYIWSIKIPRGGAGVGIDSSNKAYANGDFSAHKNKNPYYSWFAGGRKYAHNIVGVQWYGKGWTKNDIIKMKCIKKNIIVLC